MEYFEWAIRIMVIGIAGFAIRGYITERTKKVRASDQYLTVGEIKDRCKDQKEQIVKEVETEMKHMSEAIEANLERGQERFNKLDERFGTLEQKQQENSDTLLKISINLERLIKNATAQSTA